MNVYRVQNTNFTPAHDHLVALSLDSAAARIGIAIGYHEPPPADGGVPDPANQRSANGTDYGMTPALTVDFADLRARHGWCDHQVYILATQGRFPTGLAAPIPLFACTLTERLAPHDLAVRNQFNIIAALVVPFKASCFDDCSLLVNLPGDKGALVVDVGSMMQTVGRCSRITSRSVCKILARQRERSHFAGQEIVPCASVAGVGAASWMTP